MHIICRLPEGNVEAYKLSNGTIEVEILNYGGIVRSLKVADNAGSLGDIVLGYDNFEYYLKNPSYFGAIIGRCANRIINGHLKLDDRHHQLTVNADPCHLHGGKVGFNHRLWQAVPFEEKQCPGLRLQYISPDGEEGYPGQLCATVTYLLRGQALCIEYSATTDAPTIVNLTHHSYFNLAGHGDINDHILTIFSDLITPMNEYLVPTGELMAVDDTPFDFRRPHTIGQRIDMSHDQLSIGSGYDHNFIISCKNEGLIKAAHVKEPVSGREMEVWTSEPGIQFYAGNFIDATLPGKNGAVYGPRCGFCLETQHFPNAPDIAVFPSIVLKPDEVYSSRTEYRFFAEF
ncbi:galactose mutarotase [bacterium]|nr:galactose mutarotase [bacterium]